MATLRTIDDVADWCTGAQRTFKDPATPVGLIFARWVEDAGAYRGEDVVVGPAKGEAFYFLRIGPAAFISLEIQQSQPLFGPRGELDIFGAVEITDGVWCLTPSLNIPRLLHCFVVLYEVPKTANWVQSSLVRLR